MTKRVCAVLICLVLVFGCFGCVKGNTPESGVITITDCAGRTVQVPKDPQSICTVCPFSGQMIILLGAGEHITSTVNNVARSNLLSEICPAIDNAVVVKNSGSINAEEVMALNTDLIFVNTGAYETDAERAKLDVMGIPYVVIGYETIHEQLQAIRILGQALGREEAAERYIKWFEDTLRLVDDTLKDTESPVRLYHSVNEAVRTDQPGSYCAEWIAHTKVTNVSLEGGALQTEGDKAYTTLEQIYAWEPDIIVCNEAQVDDYILTDEKWQGLGAVIAGKVYQIPIGVTRWGHPTSVETPLALMWLAELLYPDMFDINIDAEIRQFFNTFYGFAIDDEWIEAIKEGDNMRRPKTENKVD